MKKIKIYGITNTESIDSEYQIIHNTFSNNIGNNLFNSAVYKSLDWNVCETVDTVSECDYYCLVLANAFSIYFQSQLDILTDNIKNYKKKTVVIGGGIHHSHELSDISLCESVKKFANAVLNTGGLIGVRGNISFSFFKETLGIKDNIFNIGCPSMRYYGKDIPKQKKYKKYNNDLKIATNFTPFGDSNELASFFDRIWRSCPNSFVLFQDQCEGLLLLEGKETPDNRIRELYPCYKQHFMVRHGRCRIKPVIHEWIGMLNSFDFSIGSRIHGCVAAILAGIPALLIAIDERQVEIAQYYHIPYIRRDIIRRDTPLSALYEYACENMHEIYEYYPHTLKKYKEFFELNGLPVNEEFLN